MSSKLSDATEGWRGVTSGELFGPDVRTVAFLKDLVPVLGIKATLLLSQLIYWRGRRKSGDAEWTYKSHADITTETGLTRREQDRAREVLKALLLLETRKMACFKTRLEYRLDLDAIRALYATRVAPNEAAAEASVAPGSASGAPSGATGAPYGATGGELSGRNPNYNPATADPPDSDKIPKKTLLRQERDALKEKNGSHPFPAIVREDPTEPGLSESEITSPSVAPYGATVPAPDVVQIFELWNATPMPEHLRERTLTPDLAGRIQRALKRHGVDYWRDVFGHMSKSAWLRGSAPQCAWRGATLGWILSEKQSEEVRGGRYDDREDRPKAIPKQTPKPIPSIPVPYHEEYGLTAEEWKVLGTDWAAIQAEAKRVSGGNAERAIRWHEQQPWQSPQFDAYARWWTRERAKDGHLVSERCGEAGSPA